MTLVLFSLSVGFWSYYGHLITQAGEYENEIMELHGFFRNKAKQWIMKHEPQIYNNPYDIVALSTSFFGIVSLIGYAVTKK